MRCIGIIILLVLCLTLLLLTGCMTNTVTPEIDMGNFGNQTSNNPTTDPVEEPATEEPGTVEVDTTKPIITGSRAPLPNSFGWNNTDVTVSFSCVDTDPVKSAFKKNTVAGKTLTKEGKNQSVTNTGVLIDAAGNTADPVTVSDINIDKTPPVVVINLPDTGLDTGVYLLNEVVMNATWSATDALSGVVSPVSGTISIDTSSVGTKTFTLPAGIAIDKAGNSSLKVTKSYSVIVDTEEPVEEPGTVYPQKWATGTGTIGDPWAGSCIEDALVACPSGGTIYLRAGYYQLAGQATITKPVNIIGEGMGNTIIKTADAHGFFATTIDNITIKNLTIDGDAQDTAKYRACIVFEFGCEYNIVENVEAKNGGQFGINVHNNSYGLFKNLYLHGNREDGIHPSANAAGTDHDNIYDGLNCWNNYNGLDAGSDAPYYGHNNTFNNINAWENSGAGIAITYNIGSVLSNSFANGNGEHGIYIWPVEDLIVSNCFASLNTGNGIHINESENVSLTNVISKNNDGEAGIYINNSNGTKLTSCQSYDDRVIPLQDYGIVNGDSSTADYITVTNCTLLPNKIASIYNVAGTVVTVITEKMLAKL